MIATYASKFLSSFSSSSPIAINVLREVALSAGQRSLLVRVPSGLAQIRPGIGFGLDAIEAPLHFVDRLLHGFDVASAGRVGSFFDFGQEARDRKSEFLRCTR